MCKRQSLYSNVDGDANVAMARFPNDPHAPPHSKLAPKFLSTGPGQKEITHSPRQQIFKNLFPATVGRVGENYDLLYQNSVRK